MKMTFLPKTKLAKISTFLTIAFFIFIGVFYLLVVVFDQRGGDTFFSNPLLTIPMLLAWASAFFALITSIVAVLRDKSRAILVFISMIIGLLVTGFGLMEVIFPH